MFDIEKLTYLPNGLAQGAAFLIGGAAGDHTLASIVVGDTLLSVVAIEFAAGVPSDVHGLLDEFTIPSDGIINNDGGTDTTEMLLIVQASGGPMR